MGLADERTEVVFGANIGGLLSGVKEAQVAVKESVEGMKGHLETLQSAVSGIQRAFFAFTAVLAGGEMFEHAIEHTAELGAQLEVLSTKTGIAADELSRLRFAAGISEVSAASLDTGLTRLARGMQAAAMGTGTASLAYEALGIKVKDAEGHLRPTRDVIVEIAEKFHGMEDGAGKTAIAMNFFGRSGADMIPFLNQGAAGIAKLEQESDRLGNTMSEKTIAASVEYVAAMKRVTAETHGFSQAVAGEVMPILSSLANSFTDSSAAGTGTSLVVEVIAAAMRVLATAVIGVKYTFGILYDYVKFALTSMGDGVGGLAAAFDLAVHGHFGAARDAVKQIGTDMAAHWDEMTDNMVLSTQKAHDSIASIFGFGDVGDKHEGPKKGGGKAAPGLGNGKDKEKSTQLADAMAEWQAMQDGATVQGDKLLELERKFWTSKLATIRQGEKDTESATLAMNGKRIAAEHKLAQDEKKAAEVRVQITRDAELEKLDVERSAIEEQRARHEISAADAESRLISVNARVLQIKVDAIEAQKKLETDWVVKQAEYDQKIETAKRTAAASALKISKDTTLQIAKDWDAALSHITDAIRISFQGVMQGTQTLGDAMRNLFRNITLDFVAGKAVELKTHLATELAKRNITTATVAHHVLSEIAKTAATVTGATARLAVEIGAAIKSMAISTAQAFMGMAAWLSSMLGPFAIPVALGAAAGAFSIGTGMLHSAAGGYDIPAGINPMTQLHAQEMVLPAKYADMIRGMAEGGGGGGGSGATVHIHAMDAQSFVQFAKANPDAFGHGVAAAIGMNHGALCKALRTRNG